MWKDLKKDEGVFDFLLDFLHDIEKTVCDYIECFQTD